MFKQNLRLALSIFMVFTILLFCMNLYFENRDYKKAYDDKIFLKATDNGVILSEGNNIISSYDIILENLPITDRKALEAGIEFTSIEQAKKLIEDYDG